MPNYPIRVGFCAPSRAVMDISTPALAKLYFTDRGADVVLHDTVFKNVKQFAGTDAERVDGLMSLACNKDIDLILPIRGGYGLSRILDKIDYDVIARHSPVFCGYSDFTAFNLAYLTKTGQVSYQGPNGTDFVDTPAFLTEKSFHSALFNEEWVASFPCKEAIFVHDTYCFHPVKFIQEIKKLILHSSVRIYENTRVTALDHDEDGYTLYTNDHKIKAQQVIITTHYPFFVIPKLLPLQLKLEKSYLLESERKEEPLFLAISTDAPHYTFRIDEEHFIFGGYSHNLASKLDYQKEKEEMMNTFKNHFDKEIRYVWSAHDVLSKDHLPFIGSISENHPNLFIATAFHKWGMTNSFLAGKLLSDLILEKENPYQKLFSPTRKPSLKGIVDATMNDVVIGGRYLQTKMQEQQVFYKNIHFEKEDDEEIAVYTDEDGIEHKIKYRCPHLKSGLIFDESEKIWICPAHGSRFDVDGHLLEGPATCDLTYEK